jgi:hypothetical protein
VIVVKDRKARMKRHPGLKSSLAASRDGVFDEGGDWTGISFSSSDGVSRDVMVKDDVEITACKDGEGNAT